MRTRELEEKLQRLVSRGGRKIHQANCSESALVATCTSCATNYFVVSQRSKHVVVIHSTIEDFKDSARTEVTAGLDISLIAAMLMDGPSRIVISDPAGDAKV